MIVPCSSCAKPNRVPASRLDAKARCAACKATLLPLSHPISVGDAGEFHELIRSSPLPVLVDFWASWCGPCRAVAPEVEKLATERQGRLVTAKVDSDALSSVAARFGIRSIPTLVLFREGQEVARTTGAMPAAQIAAQLAV